MRLSIIDRLVGREDEPERPDAAPAPRDHAGRTGGAVGPSLEPPILSGASDPAASRPDRQPAEPASAVRTVAQWAGRDAVSLLNELPPSTRERAAEALAVWHDTEAQLGRSLNQTRGVLDD